MAAVTRRAPAAASLDRAGRRRSPAATAGQLVRRSPRNKGKSYPPDPPSEQDVQRVLHVIADDMYGARLRAVIALLWRGGLNVSEALSLHETAVDAERGEIRVPGRRARGAVIDEWAVEQLIAWLPYRYTLPDGPLLCIIGGPTAGQAWSANGVRVGLRQAARAAGVTSRFAPAQLRYAYAVALLEHGASPLAVITQLAMSKRRLALLGDYLPAAPVRLPAPGAEPAEPDHADLALALMVQASEHAKLAAATPGRRGAKTAWRRALAQLTAAARDAEHAASLQDR